MGLQNTTPSPRHEFLLRLAPLARFHGVLCQASLRFPGESGHRYSTRSGILSRLCVRSRRRSFFAFGSFFRPRGPVGSGRSFASWRSFTSTGSFGSSGARLFCAGLGFFALLSVRFGAAAAFLGPRL